MHVMFCIIACHSSIAQLIGGSKGEEFSSLSSDSYGIVSKRK